MAFGMGSAQVERTLGPPIAKTKNFLGQPKLIYPNVNVEFEGDRLVEMTFSSYCHLSLGADLIANSADGKDMLLRKSANNFTGNGSIVLMDIGVAISDDREEIFPLTVFARGRMDPLVQSGSLQAM
ncbi:MAG: hypothetical protein ACJ8C4_09330 [Gemmataceae bacterium]